jgi:hypothetical protein
MAVGRASDARGQVFLVRLDPTLGSQSRRPAQRSTVLDPAKSKSERSASATASSWIEIFGSRIAAVSPGAQGASNGGPRSSTLPGAAL